MQCSPVEWFLSSWPDWAELFMVLTLKEPTAGGPNTFRNNGLCFPKEEKKCYWESMYILFINILCVVARRDKKNSKTI